MIFWRRSPCCVDINTGFRSLDISSTSFYCIVHCILLMIQVYTAVPCCEWECHLLFTLGFYFLLCRWIWHIKIEHNFLLHHLFLIFCFFKCWAKAFILFISLLSWTEMSYCFVLLESMSFIGFLSRSSIECSDFSKWFTCWIFGRLIEFYLVLGNFRIYFIKGWILSHVL